MRIVTYDLGKSENDLPTLVKESSRNFPEISNIVSGPKDAVKVLNHALQLDRKMEEHLCIIALRNGKIIGVFDISRGTSTTTIANISGMFTRLLLCGATNFIVAHNHPSGNESPSGLDVQLTEKIKEAAELMEITFNDHIIIGANYFSFQEADMM